MIYIHFLNMHMIFSLQVVDCLVARMYSEEDAPEVKLIADHNLNTLTQWSEGRYGISSQSMFWKKLRRFQYCFGIVFSYF